MEKVSAKHHLCRRNGVYYYRRRVPLELVQAFGKNTIQFSLGTTNLTEAKKRRAAEDLKWTTQFEAAEKKVVTAATAKPNQSAKEHHAPLTEAEVIRLVQEYVERTDARAQQRLSTDPPSSEREKREMLADAETGAEIARSRDDPRGDELIYLAGKKILASAGRSINDPALNYAAFADWVRRGVLELDHRKLARLNDDHRLPFFDHQFGRPHVTFGELAAQYMQFKEADAAENRTGQKWLDKQHAQVALLSEIIGKATSVEQIGFDECMRVRGLIARMPANRIKIYKDLPLDEAIARAEAEQKPRLSSFTQERYLASLREILDLAAKKRLIPVNPAEGIKPIKKETVSDAAKRVPFTAEQLKQFFESDYYQELAQHSQPYRHANTPWRFWLPLLCLFMGLRPNEVCQMNADDVKRTTKGTWYLDIVASQDEEDGATGNGLKTLKTASSRRKVPVHPELIKVGFLAFAEEQKKASGSRLFPDIKPDQYGNYASYALKRFRDTFLPKAITLKPRQTFYSFRHNFRDALRRIDAPPDALQALGGWSQGKLTSDSYGDKSDPDYQSRFIKKIAFPSLELSHLHMAKGVAPVGN
jgi:integrase